MILAYCPVIYDLIFRLHDMETRDVYLGRGSAVWNAGGSIAATRVTSISASF